MERKAGIYCLYFETDNNIYYIGQSTNVSDRYYKHLSDLGKNSHHNWMLQEGFHKYGTPSILIIEEVEELEELTNREIYWINQFDSYYNGMNATLGGEYAYGESNPWALYSKEVYLAILDNLVYTNLSYKEIATKLKVSDRVVGSIGSGNTHKWLALDKPTEYRLLLEKAGTRRGSAKHSNEVYIDLFEKLAFSNMRICDISRETNVSYSVIEKMATLTNNCDLLVDRPDIREALVKKIGNRHSRAQRSKAYPKVVSPDGVVYSFTSARTFAREHNLQQSNLTSLVNNKIKSHKGWRVYNEEVDNVNCVTGCVIG